MGWLAVDKNGREMRYEHKPSRSDVAPIWVSRELFEDCEKLPKGSIKKLIGRELTWEDEPIELKDE